MVVVTDGKGDKMEARILIGDARKRLAELPSGSVRTCITSPPYFGLRDYGESDQMGLEETPEAYVEEMVFLFREVRRVLADDGTLWLNLGDSYAGSGKGRNADGSAGKSGTLNKGSMGTQIGSLKKADIDLPAKNLIGIPWKVAFALQADGWILRQDIIWAKPNPMPESVTDRCTKSHEYVFLLSKSARYYYDHVAVKENASGRIPGNAKPQKGSEIKTIANGGSGLFAAQQVAYETRNKRDVWTIASKPFKGAHFAVMPEALVEPCVLAGSAEGDTVLDPFTGSGTVAVVALRHGRNFVGTELNPEYGEIAKDRITKAAPMFNEVVIDE
jgi:DNA modification methylase